MINCNNIGIFYIVNSVRMYTITKVIHFWIFQPFQPPVHTVRSIFHFLFQQLIYQDYWFIILKKTRQYLVENIGNSWYAYILFKWYQLKNKSHIAIFLDTSSLTKASSICMWSISFPAICIINKLLRSHHLNLSFYHSNVPTSAYSVTINPNHRYLHIL